MFRLATLLVSALTLIAALPACSSLDKADQIRARDEKLPVIITAANISVPNAIDGVTFLVSWANTSTKSIKYVKFEAQPYNAVGDPVRCEFEPGQLFPFDPQLEFAGLDIGHDEIAIARDLGLAGELARSMRGNMVPKPNSRVLRARP